MNNAKGQRIKNMIQLLRSPSELALLYRESARIQKLLKKLPFYISFTLVVLVLYSAALLTWKVIPEPLLAKPVITPNGQKIGQQSQGMNYSAIQIAKYSLFGQHNRLVKITPTIRTTAVIKETNVKIGLIGIISSEHKHENRIITSGSGADILYKTGQMLPGNIKLESIHPDHIILIINNKPFRKTLKTIEAREAHRKLEKKVKKEK